MPAPSPLLMQPRHSLDSRKALALRGLSSQPLDLATLRVSVAELRLTSDGTWLYVLQLSTASARWELLRRYSELREFWMALCERIGSSGTCEEHVHFLEGLEGDKFPKKRLLHTKNALEARANDLDDCFLRLSMRLNLCSDRSSAICQTRGCPVLSLLADFLQVPSSPLESFMMDDAATSPLDIPQRAPLAKYRSYPLTRGGLQRSNSSRRLSFAERRDSQGVAGPRSL